MSRIYKGIIYNIVMTISLLSVFISPFTSMNVKAGTPSLRENVPGILGAGNIVIGVEGMDYTSDEAALLAKINAARKDACENGVTPDPRNPSRKLQASDYVEIKIGDSCRKAARIRACEAALKMAHERPIGVECLSILKAFNPGNLARAENLAWDSIAESNVDLWINEKNAYLGKETGQTGHYASLINPDYKYTGMATFNPKNDTSEYDWACTAGQYSSDDTPVTLETAKSEEVIQKIEIPVSKVTDATIPGDSFLKKGDKADLCLLVGAKYTTEVSTNSVSLCPVYEGVTWTTSDDSVLSIDTKGHIEANKEGEASITATIGTGSGVLAFTKAYIVADSSVTITGVEAPAMINVESDRKPELPVTVKANLSNGKKADVEVVWNSYDESKLLTYFESREFEITGKVKEYNVTQKIHVNAAIMTGTYTNPSVITTEPGVEPTYPKACVGMSNGYAFQDIDVIWEEESLEYYKKEEGGTFTMKGKTEYEFSTDGGKKQFDVTLTLIVKSPVLIPDPPPGGDGEETPGSGGGETPGSGGGETPSSGGETPGSGGSVVPDSQQSTDKGGETDTDNNTDSQTADKISVGDEKNIGDVRYQVTSVETKSDTGYAGEVAYSPANKKVKTVEVPSEITIDGRKYKVTGIAKNAFKGNKKLTKITIGKNVTKIGDNAFNGCSKLKKITFKGTSVKTMGKSAFKGVPKSAKAKAPKSAGKKYKKLLKKAKYKGKLG